MKNALVDTLCHDVESFFLISGPCVVEDYDTCAIVADHLSQICDRLEIPYVFKASLIKANRTKADSFRSIGYESALDTLSRVKDTFGVAVTTDVHDVSEVLVVSEVIDIIQIPAFLCRQTVLLEAAADTGLPVNIKKGQFMNAHSMEYAAAKITGRNNPNVFLTERGNSFGYNDLIVDIHNIPRMKSMSKGVIMDCTHATQRTNQPNGISGGNTAEAFTLMKAAIAVGADGLFVETHPDPSRALSDGANMLPLEDMSRFLTQAHALSIAVKTIS